jgi:hypothetical protein
LLPTERAIRDFQRAPGTIFFYLLIAEVLSIFLNRSVLSARNDYAFKCIAAQVPPRLRIRRLQFFHLSRSVQ